VNQFNDLMNAIAQKSCCIV